jgi:hypothetical protein
MARLYLAPLKKMGTPYEGVPSMHAESAAIESTHHVSRGGTRQPFGTFEHAKWQLVVGPVPVLATRASESTPLRRRGPDGCGAMARARARETIDWAKRYA